MLVCSMMMTWMRVSVGVQYDEAMKQCKEFMVLYNTLRAEMSGQHWQHRPLRRQNRRLSLSTMFDCTFNSVTSTVDKYALTCSTSLILLNICVCVCLLLSINVKLKFTKTVMGDLVAHLKQRKFAV